MSKEREEKKMKISDIGKTKNEEMKSKLNGAENTITREEQHDEELLLCAGAVVRAEEKESKKKEQNLSDEELKNMVRHQMRVIKKGAADLVGEEELEKKVENSILTGRALNIKFGMDPSAPDIHLGHAVALRKLKQMQDLGHNIIIVIGDFTGKIGDPTGKSRGRKAMTDQEVLENALTYQEQIFHILDKEKTQVRYNGEWLELLQLDEVLELASAMTVARMLERDDFERRFHNNIPIGLHEFFYPLMQAFDSVELQADLELGGTDQTFNILMGRALQREKGQEPQAALFMPILEGTDGVEKMSKSLGNYIGIHEDARTMFRKVMEIPDSLIVKYFDLATDILPEDLDQIKEDLADGCNPKESKLILARAITGLYHTQKETEDAANFFEEAFTRKAVPSQVDSVQVVLERSNLLDCIRPLVQEGVVNSGSELRRLIAQGGILRNGNRVNAPEEPIQNGDVLRIGKKRFVKLELV